MDDLVSNGQRWQTPVPCPATTVLLGNPALPSAEPRLRDVEAAALLRALGNGNAALLAAQSGLEAASSRVVNRYHAAHHAIDDVNRYVAREQVSEARRAEYEVARLHADDGPENLRRRVLPKWMIWVVLTLAAIFDVAFVGNVVQRIFAVGPDHIVYWLAYLPGVGLALCLLTAGHNLAEHLFRYRIRATRAPRRGRLNPWLLLRKVFWDWRPQEQSRQDRDLPWDRLAGPVAVAGLALGVLAAGAYVRAVQADSFSGLGSFRFVFVGILVLLSLSAVAVKVLSHNPYADSADEARRGMAEVQKRSNRLRSDASARLVEHSSAWSALQSAILSAEIGALRIVEDECARILDERGRRGADGSLRLPLSALAWLERGEESTEPEAVPGLRLDILQNARDIADRHDPRTLRATYLVALAALNRQLRLTGPATGQEGRPPTIIEAA
ncbi:hypothetical protein AB0B85_31125 [Micromonospora sp. NPDC049044]|uniref:hypothetical protein n=1 Tax=Micromonospora sp. NPDC049044 TaxID=3154827 RepID=UPI0033D716A0